jgi:hypothetical protein
MPVPQLRSSSAVLQRASAADLFRPVGPGYVGSRPTLYNSGLNMSVIRSGSLQQTAR